MKVLWVSLVEFPPLSAQLGKPVPAHCGWLYSSAKALLQNMPDCELGVIVYSYGKTFEEYEVEGITYYMVPTKNMAKTDKRQVESCRKALKRFSPDLIHIHGTEHSLAKAVCLANEGKVKTVANIQGLAGSLVRYADGGLSLWDKVTNITPLDFYRGTFLLNAKRNLRYRTECENYVITHISDIIGRTRWDRDHALTVNPHLNYHFMNETLRDSFYETPIWQPDKCKKHTIFVSNSSAPLKGAHQMLKALPIILKQYPDTVVKFCGSSVMNNDFKSMLHFQGYHLYLRRLVKSIGVQNHVEFLGTLSEEEMKRSFLDAHVYVMPSAIENSPNSLCEAQILGVPVVASYCGGTPTLVNDGQTGYLYRFEEVEMLAQRVVELFAKDEVSLSALSERERNAALMRHDRKENARRLIDIYYNLMR
ncbi:MAG: glycosyltransferase family 4 protein [Prevotella sp.]